MKLEENTKLVSFEKINEIYKLLSKTDKAKENKNTNYKNQE